MSGCRLPRALVLSDTALCQQATREVEKPEAPKALFALLAIFLCWGDILLVLLLNGLEAS